MKTLYLVRHAKSSWDNPEVRDIDRPLNKRGLRDAPFMGKLLAGRLAGQGESLDMIMTSPARRAVATARHFAEALGMPLAKIHEAKNIYDAGPETLHDLIFEIDDNVKSAMLVGHNPGMTQLAMALSPSPIMHMATCSIVGLQFPVQSWHLVRPGIGTLKLFETPKNHLE
jgi:phosphohistidine phosphatase